MIDALPATEALEDRGKVVGTVGRDQDRDRLSDDLVGGVPVQALRAGVPADDRSIEGLADDGIIRRVDDLREIRRRPHAALTFGNVCLCPHGRSLATRSGPMRGRFYSAR